MTADASVPDPAEPVPQQSPSTAGTDSYGGQPGPGGYEQGFDGGKGDANYARWKVQEDKRLQDEYHQYKADHGDGDADSFDEWLKTRNSTDGQRTDGARTGKSDGLGAVTSSSAAGDGSGVSSGKIVSDPMNPQAPVKSE